ncbi:unnamed protein product [Trifolium pratense]|uniref:Uncharacterized protein n=1 Tax=Trifolium pratense TaxID=57577 RepID=A0ACB0J6H5_TRIPR|nr:unnamed protein product [Trifolium pratense]
MGYAFINMLSHLHVVPFYKAFHEKKREKFTSDKVATLADAQIQRKAEELAKHFEKRMHKPKKIMISLVFLCYVCILSITFNWSIYSCNFQVLV